MLGSDFKTLDDQYSVVDNQLIKDADIKQMFITGYFKDKSYYRPLTNLSYWLEYHVVGLNPFQYNVDNLWLHAANAMLVFAFVSCLSTTATGFWVGLLFAIHPIQWESVANISGRAILLSTFFSLLSLLTAWFAIHRRRRFKWLCFSLIAFTGALLSKESGIIVFPLVVGLMFFTHRFTRYWKMLIPFVVIIGCYVYLRHILDITETFRAEHISMWLLGIASFLYALIDLMRLFILPVDLHFDRSAEHFLLWSDWRVWAGFGVWLLIAGSLWVGRRRINAQGWFLIALIVLSLLPVAQIVTSIGVHPGRLSVAEHFLYFTAIGMLYWIVTAIQWLFHHAPKDRHDFMRLLIGAVIAMAVCMTVELNIYASNEYNMISRSLSINPENARLNYSMGFIYAMIHHFPEAEAHFRKSVSLDPLNARYRISLGKSICDQGRLDECLVIYDSITDAGFLSPLLAANKQVALLQKEKLEKK